MTYINMEFLILCERIEYDFVSVKTKRQIGRDYSIYSYK